MKSINLTKYLLATSIAFAPFAASAENQNEDGSHECSQRKGKRGHGNKAGFKQAIEQANLSDESQVRVEALMEKQKETKQANRAEMKAAHESGDPVEISALRAKIADQKAAAVSELQGSVTENEWSRIKTFLKELHEKRRAKRDAKRREQSQERG